MKYLSILLLSVLFIIVATGCGNGGNTTGATGADSLTSQTDTSSLAGKLKIIKGNFSRINVLTSWTKTDTVDLEGESTEGGEATYFYTGKTLEKIVERAYGETGQSLTEFYALNGELSFVFEKIYRYNRPMYYDSTAMKEDGDTEAFDFDKSKSIETRSYFYNGSMLYQVSALTSDTTLNSYSTKEASKIISEFNRLVAKNKR